MVPSTHWFVPRPKSCACRRWAHATASWPTKLPARACHYLAHLLELELDDRSQRRAERRLQEARFPHRKTLGTQSSAVP